MKTKFQVNSDGRVRLDSFLAGKYPAISRSFLQKLCSTDQVNVNGHPEKSGFKLKYGDEVVVLYDMKSIGKIEDIDLPILFEDDSIVVINKPAGIISHARGRYWNEASVASFVRQMTGQEGERAGIVHRLDRVTSGVMICAKTSAAMVHLQKQFADRKVIKIYQAVVQGHLKPEHAVIDMPIERNPKMPSTFRVGPNGKPSQTQYKVIASSMLYDSLELVPKTGRTHQLRVHLKHIGHPIVGDVLYEGIQHDRLLLHAYSLQLTLPNGKSATFTAPLPKEFANLIKNDV
ncbi:RluA family pseudouridine synthase [Candidatus Saccharibacteria bacterium]|nr:RluA family pseudouridine synthase [Candidatus Saccharibacteria bacterium]